MEFYNKMTSESGAKVIISGWEASGILDAVKMGSTELPSIDPFHDISPLISSPVQVDSELGDHHKLTEEIREHFVNIDIDTDDSDSENEEWVDKSGVDFNRNAFDIIIDDELEE